jgi:exopolysaccharide production protein ExoQ
MATTQRGTFGRADFAAFFSAPRFTAALSLIAFGLAFSTHLLRALIGTPGLLGALGMLVVLCAISFVAQRHLIEWHGLLPISILAFVGWSILSIFWSEYREATIAGVLYQLAFTFVAIYIALVRDTIQIVRAVGDVLRVLLGVSLGLEILSGLLIDMPLPFLSIQGNIALGGPIQGIFGTRNQLSIVALIAFVTFLIELQTKSLRRGVAIPSIAVAVVCILFAHSPVIAAVLVLVALAMLALFILRKIKAEHRKFYQWGLLALSLVVIAITYLYRTQVINLLNARSDFTVRYSLWIQIWQLIPLNQFVGWGWVGRWPTSIFPFDVINANTESSHTDGLNAYLDVWLQLGLIGFLLFIGLVVLAFGRGWLLASNKRSVVYSWVPLVLIALVSTSLFESSILVEYGWLLLVVCAVKSAQGMSWRSALPHRGPVPEPPAELPTGLNGL